jgi:hypothetical protein
LDTPLPPQAPLNQPPRRGADVSDLRVPRERFKGVHNLRALVRNVPQLCLGEERVQDAQVCVP